MLLEPLEGQFDDRRILTLLHESLPQLLRRATAKRQDVQRPIIDIDDRLFARDLPCNAFIDQASYAETQPIDTVDGYCRGGSIIERDLESAGAARARNDACDSAQRSLSWKSRRRSSMTAPLGL